MPVIRGKYGRNLRKIALWGLCFPVGRPFFPQSERRLCLPPKTTHHAFRRVCSIRFPPNHRFAFASTRTPVPRPHRLNTAISRWQAPPTKAHTVLAGSTYLQSVRSQISVRQSNTGLRRQKRRLNSHRRCHTICRFSAGHTVPRINGIDAFIFQSGGYAVAVFQRGGGGKRMVVANLRTLCAVFLSPHQTSPVLCNAGGPAVFKAPGAFAPLRGCVNG